MQQADRGGSGQQGGQAQQRRQDHQRVADHHAAVGPQRPSQVAQGGAGDHAQYQHRKPGHPDHMRGPGGTHDVAGQLRGAHPQADPHAQIARIQNP
ncbi:hypothetical protein G6F31_019902 [Rhizopus arrhizus]|nr:hypothetical protein G6F31_019902 [Rhizopus arrhizus]